MEGSPEVPHIHRIDHLLKLQANEPWYMQYVLNPSLSWNDVIFVAKLLVVLITTRFILCGALRSTLVRSKNFVLPRLFRPFIKPKKELKFAENLWYFTWHFVSFFWGVRVLILEGLTAEQPGWSRLMFRHKTTVWYWFATEAENKLFGNPGWPLFTVAPYVRYYYLSEIAFWLSCFGFLWLETMRTDAKVFFVHHMATCFLLLCSYMVNLCRLGIVVLVIHDAADIFLYLAKSLHYMHIQDKLVDFIFFLFVAVFCISRLIIYPLFCLWPCLSIKALLEKFDGVTRWDIPGAISKPVFLIVLQILHIFWFALIVKMIMRTLKKSSTSVNADGDIRSDDELNITDVSKHNSKGRQKNRKNTTVRQRKKEAMNN